MPGELARRQHDAASGPCAWKNRGLGTSPVVEIWPRRLVSIDQSSSPSCFDFMPLSSYQNLLCPCSGSTSAFALPMRVLPLVVLALGLLTRLRLATTLALLASMCQHIVQALALLMSTLLAALAHMVPMAGVPAATPSHLQEAAHVEEVEEAVAESFPWGSASTDDALLPT